MKQIVQSFSTGCSISLQHQIVNLFRLSYLTGGLCDTSDHISEQQVQIAIKGQKRHSKRGIDKQIQPNIKQTTVKQQYISSLSGLQIASAQKITLPQINKIMQKSLQNSPYLRLFINFFSAFSYNFNPFIGLQDRRNCQNINDCKFVSEISSQSGSPQSKSSSEQRATAIVAPTKWSKQVMSQISIRQTQSKSGENEVSFVQKQIVVAVILDIQIKPKIKLIIQASFFAFQIMRSNLVYALCWIATSPNSFNCKSPLYQFQIRDLLSIIRYKQFEQIYIFNKLINKCLAQLVRTKY
ncbi:hypothetical protein TTHERM_000113209 (macronuclear) [Tetrahymena thermophila SB210]|uniref:Uncharacterized protein n=1 Tax=Tetrahymena thermophila (strain SB210) TaxID=312017 RepID=W7XL71_TETTS|nr:hypothetical protein TTHERM_000113209 [Tetrahymena thermophila SB210]EWS75779.1 hypothetical protein TTHERM_000113209 [Tetrahymena thermophila SB210]|eukprot:XP_012651701.1 hypothetical protein TTHERM_000113209 [Tetrahymena thermophila SB210]